MKKLLGLIDGWKSVIGYALLSTPVLTPYPMLMSAVEALLAEVNKQNLINVVVQGVLATGIAHKLVKNLTPK